MKYKMTAVQLTSTFSSQIPSVHRPSRVTPQPTARRSNKINESN